MYIINNNFTSMLLIILRTLSMSLLSKEVYKYVINKN